MKLLTLLLAIAPVMAFASSDREKFLADIERMKSKSLRLQSEQQNLTAAKDSLLAKKLAFTPSVSATLGKNQTYVQNQLAGNLDYWQVNGSWNLFRSGGDWHALQGAAAKSEAQEHQVKSEEISEEHAVGSLIFRLLSTKDSVRAQEDLLNAKERGLQIAEARFAQGRISKEDVNRLEVDLSQQRSRLRLARLDLEDVSASLKMQFADLVETQNWPFAEEEKMPNFLGLVSQSTQKLEATALGLQHDWKSARAGYFPTIDLSVSYQESPLKRSPVGHWAGTIELKVPLWNGYQTAAETSLAYSRYLSNENQFQESKMQEPIRQNFVKSKWKAHFENTKEARENLVKSRKLYQDFERAFGLGRISTIDLLAEQNRLIDAELTLSQSQRNLHDAYLESCDAIGQSLTSCLMQ